MRKYTLSSDLFQSCTNTNETRRVDVLYNNTFDFFYFEVYVNDVLVQGSTKIVNDYSDDHVEISSLSADYASFEAVESFTIGVKDA